MPQRSFSPAGGGLMNCLSDAALSCGRGRWFGNRVEAAAFPTACVALFTSFKIKVSACRRLRDGPSENPSFLLEVEGNGRNLFLPRCFPASRWREVSSRPVKYRYNMLIMPDGEAESIQRERERKTIQS